MRDEGERMEKQSERKEWKNRQRMTTQKLFRYREEKVNKVNENTHTCYERQTDVDARREK